MEYVVQPGDTLSAIARRFGVSLAVLLAVNPEIADPDLIFPGQVVRIPLMPPSRPPVGRCLYVIQPGDTLSEIARRFGLDLDTLINANPQITNPDLIFPGQIIFVPLRRLERRPEMPVEIPMKEFPEGVHLLPEVDFYPPELPEGIERLELPHPQERYIPHERKPHHRR
ncbi:MAG: LysM peptidoglycan-binding domain-containing protein [Betaproteobacteria bacterium]